MYFLFFTSHYSSTTIFFFNFPLLMLQKFSTMPTLKNTQTLGPQYIISGFVPDYKA